MSQETLQDGSRQMDVSQSAEVNGLPYKQIVPFMNGWLTSGSLADWLIDWLVIQQLIDWLTSEQWASAEWLISDSSTNQLTVIH